VTIKSQAHLDDVLLLMRTAQKEAKRFPSKDRAATARYWEEIIDGYLAGGGKSKVTVTLERNI
jgi:hypothetical protein